MNGFWDSCLTHFERQLSAQQFNTWIKPLRLENALADGGGLRVVAPNRFVMQWVRERFLGDIEEISRKFFTGPVAIALTLPDTNPFAGAGFPGRSGNTWSSTRWRPPP